MFCENSDDGYDCERGIDLNNIEELIVVGDNGFCEMGFEDWKERVEKVLNGESVVIEMEEGMFCFGSKSSEEIEIDFMKYKIELLRGNR